MSGHPTKMISTLTPTPDGRMPYFPALDGVRAYCVLLVTYHHLKKGDHILPFIDGHLGVDLFFIISGFLITTLLLRELHFTGRIDLRSFYVRRFFRIIPVYLFVLAIYILICQLPSQAEKWIQLKASLPYFLTLTNEYAVRIQESNVFMHTWSLGVEEKFYLLWPLLFFLLAHTARTRAIVLALGFVAVAIPPFFGFHYLAIAYFGLLMGCLMAVLLAGPYSPRIFASVARLPAIVPLALFALGFYVEYLYEAGILVFSSCAIVFFIFLLSRPSWLRTAHEWRPIVWLGRRSYSMYLIHVLALNVIESKFPITSGLRAALALAAAYALAALAADILYRLIEQPARNRARTWLTRHHEIPAAI